MPCEDGGRQMTKEEREAERLYQEAGRPGIYEPDPEKAPLVYALYRLNKVTEMLCSVMRAGEQCAETMKIIHRIPGLWSWWEEHKQADHKAKLREQALMKLTPEERSALGL